MHAIARMILTSLPTIPYGTKPIGSEPVEIRDSIWAPTRKRTERELAVHAQIKEIDRMVRLHGVESLECLTPEMIDLEADISWNEAVESIPSREELVLMEEDAQASDEYTLARLYLDPPRNAAKSS